MSDEIIERFIQARTRLEVLKSNRRKKVVSLAALKERQWAHEVALAVIKKISYVVETKVRSRVESLMTKAIISVFDDRDYQFKLIFDERAGQVIYKPVVMEDDYELIPKDDMGVGIIDLISFIFRPVLWSLNRNRSRGTFFLDEPMKHIGKGELLERAVLIMKEISSRMGIQLIIITHEEEHFLSIADRAFRFTHDGKKTCVKVIKGESERKLVK